MTVERITHSGAYIIRGTYRGWLGHRQVFWRTYYGYTRREAIAEFREERRELAAKAARP
jgi:hypothetical protein